MTRAANLSLTGIDCADDIVANLPFAVFGLDSAGTVIFANPAAESLLGTGIRNFVGQSAEHFLHFSSKWVVKALVGDSTGFSAWRTPLNIKGRKTSFVDVHIESIAGVSDQRMMIIAQRPDDEIETLQSEHAHFTGKYAPDVLAHEIKNPLAAIRGASQLLGRFVDAEQRELIDLITSEVKRISALIDRVQSLSTDKRANIEPVNVHAIIDRVRKSIAIANQDQPLITVDFDPSLPLAAVDPDGLIQVLTNLMANAVDACASAEKPHIHVETKFAIGGAYAFMDSDRSIRLPIEIGVYDNGPGVPEHLEREIYSPFVSTKPGGQGLGLALVRKLVGDMRGRVQYTRLAETQQSCFRLHFPLADKE